jgi:hypothetical protein
MSNFLDAHALPGVSPPEGEGEVAGITYRVRGSGPPLVLMPLDLTPSQWEPLIEPLRTRYCTICLGGPLLGVVAILEARGRSDYLTFGDLSIYQAGRRQLRTHLVRQRHLSCGRRLE